MPKARSTISTQARPQSLRWEGARQPTTQVHKGVLELPGGNPWGTKQYTQNDRESVDGCRALFDAPVVGLLDVWHSVGEGGWLCVSNRRRHCRCCWSIICACAWGDSHPCVTAQALLRGGTRTAAGLRLLLPSLTHWPRRDLVARDSPEVAETRRLH